MSAAWSEKARRGYTLIELLVVLGILGLLASMAMPIAEVTVQRDKERELKRALWEIRDAIDAYHKAAEAGRIFVPSGASGYPTSLQSLVDGVPDLKNAGQKMVFLRRIPRDPFAPSELPPEKMWQLRSYSSDAANPAPGADVYDVSSASKVQALNGTAINQW